MAYNIQDDADDYPDLSDVLEFSRHNWLGRQEVHDIFTLFDHPNPSLEPVQPFEEGLFLYHTWTELDENDWIEVHQKQTKEDPPMPYLVARLPLEPIDDGMIATYERRSYKPTTVYEDYRLVHYRLLHTSEIIEDSGDDDLGPGDGDENAEEAGAAVNEAGDDAGDDAADDAADVAPEDAPLPLCNGHMQELESLWEKMRCCDIGKEDRSKLISEALQKMKGKIPEIAGSHVTSPVLQTCVKYCTEAEKEAVFKELQPHFLRLSCNAFSVHLLTKMMDESKQQLSACISSLRGHVAAHLRHMVGSVVVEHAYKLGTAEQKQELLGELYSPGLNSTTDKRMVDIIAKLGLDKGTVIRHMTAIVQPILDNGIVDHSITHKLLIEYLTIADQTSAEFVIQQLTGPLLMRMIHTRDGSRIAMLCIKHGSAKERKKIIKAMKPDTGTSHVGKMASDQFGCLVLACIFSMVDNTKLVTKIIVRELEATLKDLIMDRNGRRPLLHLLDPNSSQYSSHDDLASLDLSIPSLMEKSETSFQTKDSDNKEFGEEAKDEQEEIDLEKNVIVAGGKKDPLLRRQELLVNSGLAERLISVCVENAEEFLKSNIGKDVVYEVAMGGSDGILRPSLSEKLSELYEAIASVAAKPKPQEPEKNSEHVLENFHSSRTIRRLILDCPAFASTLFKNALSGNCRLWAQGHCAKILSAFLETQDLQVREMAKKELQVLVNEGILKISDTKKTE